MKEELLPKYPNVDDIVPINHAYGCGVAINAPEAKVPIRALRNLAKHPNFGGQLMVVGLGCEKFTVDMLLDQADISPENVIILQELRGFDAMVDALMKMADKKLAILNQRKRVTLPLSKLCIGMQCGGSDAFSGVTANPSAGYAADMLVKGGATVLFSEVTEVRDGVHYLAERCISPEVRDKLAAEMRWYDNYLAEGEVDRSANPTPGNKKGGLCNIVEKAMGSIAKSGTSYCRSAFTGREARQTRTHLCGYTCQRYCLRSLSACVRNHCPGIYDRTGNALWSGSSTCDQGLFKK